MFFVLCFSHDTYASSITNLEWDSQKHFTRSVVSFDQTQPAKYQVCDRIKDEGYFYIDIYDITTLYMQRVIDVSDPSLLKIVAVPYWDHGVLRLVFYVRDRSATFDIKTVLNPSRLVVDVVVPESNAVLQGVPIGKNQAYLVSVRDDAETSRLLTGMSGVKEYTLPDLPRSVGERMKKRSSVGGKRRLVIIDPGHGGDAPGATSGAGFLSGRPINEKDLNLQFAYALKREIDATNNMTAVLTRTSDSSLTLSDRVKLAEARQGDLFISIHMNYASTPEARGVEIFFLSEKGTAQSNLSLEKAENAEVGDVSFFSGNRAGILNNILSDIRKSSLESLQWESFEVCKRVITNFQGIPYFRNNNRGVKSANFYVLKNKQMPAVLLEVGFMSNREDLACLVTPRFQDLTAKVLCEAISEYFRKTEQPIK